MADPIYWKTKVLLAKIEGIYGTDSAPTGADDAIEAIDVTLSPMEGEDVARGIERPYHGAQEMIPVALRSVLTFKTELTGSGEVGTAPLWGKLLRACKCAEVIDEDVSVTYHPISRSLESLTIKFWIGDVLHAMKGTRGNWELTVTAQGIPAIQWTLTSLWTAPADTAAATPDLTDWTEPLVATKTNTPTFTVNGVALVLRTFTFNAGNAVVPRFLIGREEVRIPNSVESAGATVEAVPLATFNPFALAQARTKVAINLVHGTQAGNIATIALPTVQVQRQAGYENQDDILEWPLRFVPIPGTGNDQFSITLT